MDDIIIRLKRTCGLIYDTYMNIAAGKEEFSVKLMLLLNAEKLLYKDILDNYEIDVMDDLIESLDERYDESEIITYALERHSKKQLVNKRICDKLNSLVLLDTMQKGKEYIPMITDPNVDYDDEEFMDSEIYFEGYLNALAMGVRAIDLAYYLNNDSFKRAAFKLVYLNDFVETSYVNNQGKFVPYNENDTTLLDELYMISDDAKNKALVDIQDIAMSYINTYVDTNYKKYYSYAKNIILALPFEDAIGMLTEYYNLFDEGIITKEDFKTSEDIIIKANDQRLALKYQ